MASRATKQILRESKMLLRATRMEQDTYAFLRNKAINFTYQWPFHPYCVDFYFPDLNLVLEVDGKTHLDELVADNDKDRTEKLMLNYGVKVFRIDNVSNKTLNSFLLRFKLIKKEG